MSGSGIWTSKHHPDFNIVKTFYFMLNFVNLLSPLPVSPVVVGIVVIDPRQGNIGAPDQKH